VVRGAKNFMIHPVLQKQARQVTGDLAEEDYAGLNQYNSSAWLIFNLVSCCGPWTLDK
jgi:hypothetical protein